MRRVPLLLTAVVVLGSAALARGEEWRAVADSDGLLRDPRTDLLWTVPSKQGMTVAQAREYCRDLDMSLPGIGALLEVQGRLGFDRMPGFEWQYGPRPQPNRFRSSALWAADRGWTTDVIPVLPPVLGIPYPARASFALSIFSYRELGDDDGRVRLVEKHFATKLRPWLDDNRAQATCVGE